MSANRKNVAVVGCGNWGKNIVRSLGEMGQLAAISDPNPHNPHAKSYAEKFSCPLLSFEDVLALPSCQGVVIATPTATHFELASAALKAGKHVFVEKPLVRETDQNHNLVALAKSHDKTLMVGHILLYHPAYQAVEKIAKSDIGQILYITTRRTNLGRFFPGESALWDLAPHDLAMILNLYQRAPKRVFCHQVSCVEKGVGDFASVDLDFGDGQQANLYFSRFSPTKEQKMTIHGSKGFAVFDDTQDWNHKVTLYPSHVTSESGSAPKIHAIESKPIPLESAEPLKLELQSFIDSFDHPQNNKSDGNQALIVLAVIQAAEQSSTTKSWVDLQF
ncbi:MAG: hypothetical protein CMM87_06455 [Rickettsiales bacterium]|nr:hypothetical protein [Rickettsiales bacterium]|tara:strand:+ start:29525 stop:30523 length:999 start_codon:yes stop_codon:yes gene_type:complete